MEMAGMTGMTMRCLGPIMKKITSKQVNKNKEKMVMAEIKEKQEARARTCRRSYFSTLECNLLTYQKKPLERKGREGN